MNRWIWTLVLLSALSATTKADEMTVGDCPVAAQPVAPVLHAAREVARQWRTDVRALQTRLLVTKAELRKAHKLLLAQPRDPERQARHQMAFATVGQGAAGILNASSARLPGLRQQLAILEKAYEQRAQASAQRLDAARLALSERAGSIETLRAGSAAEAARGQELARQSLDLAHEYERLKRRMPAAASHFRKQAEKCRTQSDRISGLLVRLQSARQRLLEYATSYLQRADDTARAVEQDDAENTSTDAGVLVDDVDAFLSDLDSEEEATVASHSVTADRGTSPANPVRLYEGE